MPIYRSIVYMLMHSYIVSDPYCLLYYGPFFLFGMSVVGPLEKKCVFFK